MSPAAYKSVTCLRLPRTWVRGIRYRFEQRPSVSTVGRFSIWEKMMILIEHGLYFVKDQYFDDFPSKHWMLNKGEKRPHYYALEDPSGLIWLIPMSSQVENYKRKIQKRKKNGVGEIACFIMWE